MIYGYSTSPLPMPPIDVSIPWKYQRNYALKDPGVIYEISQSFLSHERSKGHPPARRSSVTTIDDPCNWDDERESFLVEIGRVEQRAKASSSFDNHLRRLIVAGNNHGGRGCT